VQEIRRTLAEHPKWTVNRAARDYAKRHPEDRATEDSTARRLAGKVRLRMGQPPKARALRQRYLQELQRTLCAALSIIEKLITLERRK